MGIRITTLKLAQVKPPRASVALLGAVVLTASAGLHAQEPASGTTPTFTKDVVPILQRACQRCHRPNSMAPMSLVTYDDVRPWARSIKQRVVQREMPPWHIDRTVGIQRFKDDPSLSDEEIHTIGAWVDAGAPRGNPADMPPAVAWETADRFSFEPDLIVQLKEDITLADFGSDQWLNVPMEDPGLTTDRYIQMAEIKPLKGVAVVHHANAIARRGTRQGEVGPGEGSPHIVEYAVGKAAERYPAGSGKLLAAGSQLVMNMHLHPIGEETLVNTALALKLYPEGYTPERVQFSRVFPYPSQREQDAIDIRPGDSNARTDSYHYVEQPMRITAYQPHLHNRGKRQCLEAIYPPQPSVPWPESQGGPFSVRPELISCADFQFNWHLQYTYEDDVQPLIPAGTLLHLISWHDNSAANRGNPDPTAWVGFGQRSIDEMALMWLEYNYLPDEQFEAAVRQRQERRNALNEDPQ